MPRPLAAGNESAVGTSTRPRVLGPGCLQRRRHRPGRSGLRAALAGNSATEASLLDAKELLRTLTYLQDATGPYAGNVVLWMQADGTLKPSAIPRELPDPSDSGESYWLARTVWALGEGYAAFAAADPGFAALPA